jgi:phosphoserine phosphatase RsbU/P
MARSDQKKHCGKTQGGCNWQCGRGGHLSQHPTVAQTKPVVVIIDRDQETMQRIKGALISVDIDAAAIPCGADPIQFAREVQPNLVLLDAEIARANDYQLCHEMHLGTESWRAPVILMSKYGELPDDISSLECGAIDYLNRPVSLREAVARVRTHLQLQHAIETLGEMHAADLRPLESAQKSCMPRASDLPAARFQVALRQAQSAGGDFYDVIDRGGQQFDYIVADASGHDLSSSYWTLALKTLLLEYSDLIFSPADSLYLINRALCRILPDGVFFTMIHAQLNRASGRVSLLNAGHPPAILISVESGAGLAIEQASDVLGCFADASFARVELPVNPGDRIFLYSDGLTDGAMRQGMKIDSLLRNLNQKGNLEQVVDEVFSRRLQEFPTNDDVLLMGIEI